MLGPTWPNNVRSVVLKSRGLPLVLLKTLLRWLACCVCCNFPSADFVDDPGG